MRVRPKKLVQEQNLAALVKNWSLDKWHWILSHVNMCTIKTMQRNNLVTGLSIDESKYQHSAQLVFKKNIM